MLKQRELAFIKAMSNSEVSTGFLRELGRAVVAAKKKASGGPRTNDASASALERESGSGSEALTSRDIPQLIVSKRKADELSSQDCPSEPGSRRLAPEHLFDDGFAAQDFTGEQAAKCSR
jgi:hypothetical protein